MPNAMREAAIAYAEAGWCVFPCWPRDKRPLTVNGLNDASNDPQMVRNMWHRGDANIGLNCGMNNLTVIDFDGPEAIARMGGYPETRMVRTARGFHLYYTGRAKSTAGRLGKKIDTRGLGGYVLAPPSEHPDGPIYRWVDPDVDIAPLPHSLWERLRPPKAKLKKGQRRPDPGTASALLWGARERFKATPEGERNHALNREVWFSRPWGDVVSLSQIWYSEAIAIGLDHGESVSTIASALGIPPEAVAECL